MAHIRRHMRLIISMRYNIGVPRGNGRGAISAGARDIKIDSFRSGRATRACIVKCIHTHTRRDSGRRRPHACISVGYILYTGLPFFIWHRAYTSTGPDWRTVCRWTCACVRVCWCGVQFPRSQRERSQPKGPCAPLSDTI